MCEYLEYHAQQTGDIADPHRPDDRPDQELQEGRLRVELGPDSAAAGGQSGRRSQGRGRLHAGQSPAGNRIGPQESRRPSRAVHVFRRDAAPGPRRSVSPAATTCSSSGMPKTPARRIALENRPDAGPGAVHSRRKAAASRRRADFEAITEAILEIEKQSQFLGEVTTLGRDDQKWAPKRCSNACASPANRSSGRSKSCKSGSAT